MKITMFHAFPLNRSEWQQAFQFPFRAYVVLSFLLGKYFLSIWPPHIAGSSYAAYRSLLSIGYWIDFAMLVLLGMAQLAAKRRRDANINLIFAVLSAFLAISVVNFSYS